MKQAALIFPHQLFKSSPVLSKEREIFLVEAPCFFFGGAIPLKFHKKKLLLHRASMQAYKKRLEAQGYRLHSLDFREDLFKSLRQKKVEEIWFVDPVDRGLEEGLKQEARKGRMGLHRLPSPASLTPEEWLLSFFKGAGHFSMTRFYMAQRKRLKILLEGDRPIGGKWSFDPENRKKIPMGVSIPAWPSSESNPRVEEA
ncbi:MAG: cryptochrome/photolyase family protein [Desulfobacterota bacterium]|nr:cryptochrome/photolyase family protein [Thermodesulfobacteriota bacterium]